MNELHDVILKWIEIDSKEKYPWRENYQELSGSAQSSYRKSAGIIQLSSFLLLITAAGFYCISSRRTHAPSKYPPGKILAAQSLVDPSDDWLFDVAGFTYELNSPQLCGSSHPFFIAVVHSKPEHSRQRQVIRQTWASDHRLIRAVFLLGKSASARSNVDVIRYL